MPLLQLSDTQVETIARAAAPLEPADQPAFLNAVATYLRSERVLGDGAIYRACKAVQREFFKPPTIERSPLGPRHGTKSGQAKPIWASK